MIRNKINFILFCTCFFLTCLVIPAEEPKTVHLPVRVFDKTNQPVTGLKKGDFKLTVNGRERQILKITEKEKSIGRKPGLGRFFILSFHIGEYTKQAEKGISFFVTEIAGPGDTLVVLSPVKMYRFEASVKKEEMIRHISTILKNDYKKCAAEEKNLLRMIGRLKHIFANEADLFSPSAGIGNFLDSFPRKYVAFTRRYLLPAAGQFRQIIDLLDAEGGEAQRWWLHFRERDVSTLNYDVKRIFKKIAGFLGEYVHQYASPVSRDLTHKYNQVKKRVFFSELVPSGHLLRTLLTGDICYNTIFLTGLENIDAEVADTTGRNVKEILEKISLHSGGAVVKVEKFEQGVLDLKDHVDRCYDLVFAAGSDKEVQPIRVELKEKQEDVLLVYDDRSMNGVPASASGDHAREKVKITAFSLKKNITGFSIESFKIKEGSGKGERFGLLKVEVLLLDQAGAAVYRRQNTLRASQDRLDITLSLPNDRPGTFTLTIKVSDIIANTQTSFEREITL